MTDCLEVPAAVRDRLLASARRLLMAAEFADSTERCHACRFHPRGKMDGIPEASARWLRFGDGHTVYRMRVPVTCFACGAQSEIHVYAVAFDGNLDSLDRVFRGEPTFAPAGTFVEPPEDAGMARDPDDPQLLRAWLSGRHCETPAAKESPC